MKGRKEKPIIEKLILKLNPRWVRKLIEQGILNKVAFFHLGI
jgi:hypothetical protein